MPLQPSYSRRLPRADGESPVDDRPVAGRLPAPRRARPDRRRTGLSLPLTTGLVLAAGLGAGAVIFPERIIELWQSRDWLKPSAGWSVLFDQRPTSIPPPRLAGATASAGAAPSPARAEPPSRAASLPVRAEPASQAVVVKAVDLSPATTSSIGPAKERPREAPPLLKLEPEPLAGKTIVAAAEPPSAPPKAAESAPPPRHAATLPTPEPAAAMKPAVLTAPAAEAAPTPAPLPRAAPERAPAVSAEVTEALKRAHALLERGDIAGARLLLEHAAASKDPRAIMALGETYDPAMLARWGARGIKGDAAKARALYERAAETGSVEARARMLAFR
jgi:hypothetical protein